MSNDKRISSVAVDIDYQSTQRFFEARGNAEYDNPLSATMYQDQNPDLVSQRDSTEKKLLLEHLAQNMPSRVLELGCGIGRWSWFFAAQEKKITYLGIDFSSSLIEQAKKLAKENVAHESHFQVMSVTEMNDESLLLTPPFDLIIISGLMLYLNDVDCQSVLRNAARLCTPGGSIYIREPLAVSDRLTLKEFYSEELKDNYSAIYRSTNEMDEMIINIMPAENYTRLPWQSPFGEALANRKETHQLFTLISRRGNA
ncbi:ubiquinone/menaquinone biosynthesis C-methylase UbiE [Erwinia toletana]|uniref:Ubiquinone/menaquinone biosynthesis C-methylase UbiE n=1 Tax=Winslowiella toletana TaxID=92490 RepID=A0ABS4P3A1_9GAMM|nr:class I SAM-dependent methyltransferase [Winslowiella toletana]MBP2167133.1 ubiquinone/menaquinone biosynthesis C-methylase UbiE [Winslowiella toletana]